MDARVFFVSEEDFFGDFREVEADGFFERFGETEAVLLDDLVEVEPGREEDVDARLVDFFMEDFLLDLLLLFFALLLEEEVSFSLFSP